MSSPFYTAAYLDAYGREQSGQYYLRSEREVRSEIANQGGTVLFIRRREQKWWQCEIIGQEYKSAFLRAVGFHVENGKNAGEALKLVIEGETNPQRRVEFQAAVEVLNRGGQFSEAVEMLRLFDRSVITMLKTGEFVGLKQVVQSSIAHLENKREAWKLLATAMSLLSLEWFSAFSSALFIQYTGLPWLESNGISSQNVEAVARFKDGVHMAYMLNGALLLVSVLAILMIPVAVGLYVYGRGGLRIWMDQKIAGARLVRSVLLDGALSDTCGAVGRMVGAGVEFHKAVLTARDMTIIPALKTFWNEAHQRLMCGFGAAYAMRGDMLSRAEFLALEAHSQRQQLANVLMSISSSRAESARRGTMRLIKLGAVLVVFYIIASLAIAAWVLYLQDTGISESFNSIQGGF